MPEPLENLLAVFCLTATGLLALGLLFSHLWKNHPARAHGVLAAALVGALLTPVCLFIVQLANVGLLAPKVELSATRNQEAAIMAVSPHHSSAPTWGATSKPHSEHSRGALVRNDASQFDEEFTQPIAPSEPIEADRDPKPPQNEGGPQMAGSWKTIILWAWLISSSIMALRLLIDGYTGHRLVGNSRLVANEEPNHHLARLARKIEVISVPILATSDQLPSPVLWGWSSPPRILIPNRVLSVMACEGVYLHELAHLARRDHLSALISELVLCLIPWHPLAWWTRRTLAARAEEACDDWVIACGCQPLDYAEELVGLAPSATGVFSMAAVTSGSSLKDRVSRLIHGSFAPPRLGRRWVMGLGLTTLLAASGLALFQPRTIGAEAPAGSVLENAAENLESFEPAPPTSNQWAHRFLVHAKGKPVPGAKVRIEELEIEDNQIKRTPVPGFLRTDEWGVTGTSKCLNPHKKHGISYAEDDAGRLGIMHVYPAVGHVTTLEIKPIAPIRGRVIHAGKPLAGVQCQLITLQRLDLDYVQDYPFPKYRQPQQCKTDEKGEFSLQGIPSGFAGVVQLDKEGFGLAKVSVLSGENPTIELAPAGELQVVFAGEGNPAQLERMCWSLKDANESIELSAPLRITYGRTWRFDPIQRGKILRLGAGKYQLSTRHMGREPFDLQNPIDLEIHAGKTTKLTVQAESLAEISGRVIEEKTGKGIQGVRVDFIGDKNPHPTTAETGSMETNQDGTFRMYCKGDDRYSIKTYQFHDNEGGEIPYYQKGGPFRLAKYIRVKKSLKCIVPDIAMVPGIRYRTPVLDEKGQPLTTSFEAFLAVTQPNSVRPNFPQMTNERGFSFERGVVITPQLDPDWVTAILIRKGKAVNIPDFFTPSNVPNPESIMISNDYGVSVRGIVLDPQGKPIKGARVKLDSGRIFLEQTQTSDTGKFEFTGLWPGLHYRIAAEVLKDERYDGSIDFDTIKDADQKFGQNLENLEIALKPVLYK